MGKFLNILLQIKFEYPYLLLLILIFLFCSKFCPIRVQSIIFPHLSILKVNIKNSSLISILKWMTIIFMFVALASPVIEDKIISNKKDGYNIVLTLDTSGSMREIGFDRTNRGLDKFSVVKNIVKEFIDKRIADNISFIVFGDFSYVATPLTFDKDILKDILSRLYIGIAGERTAIYDSIAQSVNILSKNKAKSKIIILLTDGINTAGKIPKTVAINLAKKHNIKVYTIGIGRDFDKRALMQIASDTKGLFFHAKNSEMLKNIYGEIDKLEKSEIKSNKFIKKEYFFIYPLFVAIISLLFYIFIRNKRGL